VIVAELLGRLDRVKPCGSGWMARCPAHQDRHASLSIAEGDEGRILVKCFAGCPPREVVAALGLTMSDLFADTRTAPLTRVQHRNSPGQTSIPPRIRVLQGRTARRV
jgi:hypothetical protein